MCFCIDRPLRVALATLLLGVSSLVSLAHDDVPKKPQTVVRTGHLPGDEKPGVTHPSPIKTVILPLNSSGVSVGGAGAVSQRMQAELDAALARLAPQPDAHSGGATEQLRPDLLDDLPVAVSEQAADDRSTARRMMGYLDNNPDRVKNITDLRFEDLMVLPVGLKINLGDGSSAIVGILKAEFLPTHAELTVFVRLQISIDDPASSDRNRDLFFGVDKLKFTREGGFSGGGSFRAVLLGDFVLPMRSWTLVLKGGTGLTTPANTSVISNLTYVDIECSKMKEASLAARLIFPRSVLVPFDEATRKPIEGSSRVGVDFTVVTDSGLRNLLASVDVSGGTGVAFAVAGFTRFGFKLSQLVVDLSDDKNAPAMVFPAGYTGEMDTRWRGVYIKEFAVLLPKEFKQKAGGGISLSAKNVLVDRAGFSGLVSYDKQVSPVSDCDARGWKLTLNYLDLEFLQNQPIRGGFGGQIFTPISNTGLTYGALIDPTTGLYSASIRTEGDLPIGIPAWRAEGLIYRGSQLELTVKNDEFYPKALLSGEFSLGSRITGSVNETDPVDVKDGTASFKQIQFLNLALQTEVPYVTVGDFRYNDTGDHKLAGFPVAIVMVGKSSRPQTADQLWLDFGFRVSLAKDRFAGASVLLIKSRYDATDGRLKFDGISVQRIYVEGTTSAYSLKGYVTTYDNTSVKGFAGSLDVTLETPFNVGITANASFGYQKADDFRYGYVDVYGEASGLKAVAGEGPATSVGIPTGIGDLLINGLGLGIYFNMKPQFAGNGAGSGCFTPMVSVGGQPSPPVFTYCPNRQIPFGFKAMVGLVNSTQSFQGRFSLDFALDRSYGINSIALAGNGVFGQKPANSVGSGASTGGSITESAYYQQMMGFEVKAKTEDELGNINPQTQTTETVQAKAKQKNEQKYGNEGGVSAEGDIAFSAGILINVPQRIFRAEGDIFINKNGLRGISPTNRAASVVLNFERGNTYLHFGQSLPETMRMGIRYQNNIELQAYLMAGVGVPRFPPPPPDVVNFFPILRGSVGYNNATDISRISGGSAFALGASLRVNLNESGWAGYIRGQAQAGLDLLITNGSTCKPGAWWGQGRIYGLVQGEIGVNILGGRRIRIAKGALGAVLMANAFNPTGFQGEVCVGRFCMPVSFGTYCSN